MDGSFETSEFLKIYHRLQTFSKSMLEEKYLNTKGITLDSKYINEFLDDLNVKHLKNGALSALQKIGDDLVVDIFESLKDDSEERIRRIAEKAIEKKNIKIVKYITI